MNTSDPLTCYASGYEDYLQVPLQPLMDNLDSSTYEVFEKDPVKYSEYQRAIYCALLDRVPADERDTNTQYVVGYLCAATVYTIHEAYSVINTRMEKQNFC